MKIAITATGTRGDVQPYVALGKGLAAAGHHVRLISTEDFAGLTAEAGLEFASIGTSIEAVLKSPEWQAVTERGNFLVILRQMNAEMRTRAAVLADQLPALLADADLVLGGLAGLGGAFTAADHFGIPIVPAYVVPFTPTRHFASPLSPRPSLGAVGNWLSFAVTRRVFWQNSRMADTAIRQRLKLPSAPRDWPYGVLRRRKTPTLYGFSPQVLPRPADWDERQHVTGCWFLDPAPDWTPPADLVAFLASGPPPVYIGFGSMGSRDPAAAAALALDALKRSGQRGVIAAGWGGLTAATVPETVYLLRDIPHSWLFPRMAAVVHHGGAGTTAAGVRAGVPSVITPVMGDQPYWGQVLFRLGVSPTPIPRKRLTVERLTAVITQAVTDAGMRQRAAALGERVRAETGVQTAVDLIARWAK